MQAGKLRHRVKLQRYALGSPEQTASGAPDGAWADYITVWASVEPLNGRELFAAQEHHSEVTHRIRIRYRDGVTADMRVNFEGVIYSVGAVIDPEMRHREMQLLCSTGVTGR